MESSSPKIIERLNRAFAHTLSSLSLVNRNDPLCELVARKVIEVDATGIHDPVEISKVAFRELGLA